MKKKEVFLNHNEAKRSLLAIGYSHPFPDSPVLISCAAPINIKYSGYFAMFPCNLDLEAHISQYPLTDYKFVDNGFGRLVAVSINGTQGSFFDIERMYFIIGLISSITANNKDLIDESGFVPINSSLLRNFFKDYHSYLDYLVKTNVFICNGRYVVNKKSLGYKFAPQYDNVPFYTYIYNSVREGCETVNPLDTECEDNMLLSFSYLNYWYTQRGLKIDKEAYRYAHKLKQHKLKLGRDSWDLNRNIWDEQMSEFARKNPETQYLAIFHNIESLNIHNYRAKIDNNVHRLHSVITNMQKDFRNFLTYEGKQLVSIDLKNSQPYLSCLLFNPEFWKVESELYLSLNHLPQNIKDSIRFNIPGNENRNLVYYLSYFFTTVDDRDFDLYRNIVAEGNMYETIITWVQDELGENIRRDDAKTTMFFLLFSPNRIDHREHNKNQTIMNCYKNRFPKTFELFKIIKRQFKHLNNNNQHARLACLLQSIESEIILHRCCKRIWEEENHKIPIFTIHDSIATTIEYKDYVKNIMMEELTKSIGISPQLSEEYWTKENLHLDYT